ncbi:Retrovirus-related Pol polyprotein from transposon 17.6 [Gossypium australe]|uniref:Retrovirus-related Pol polyprotein from transposon 17.6 n=1 Tax=Gossypium australe TaxID=47621 RepID=A0A5B6V3W7_9ROSI|nr:Retrovirus-related Pol polyprotein from transposon 17.6 [Gossypium australe]
MVTVKQVVQFKKFLDVLKKLHINILVVEALEQMPNYVKFMKDILSIKKDCSTNEGVQCVLIEQDTSKIEGPWKVYYTL